MNLCLDFIAKTIVVIIFSCHTRPTKMFFNTVTIMYPCLCDKDVIQFNTLHLRCGWKHGFIEKTDRTDGKCHRKILGKITRRD